MTDIPIGPIVDQYVGLGPLGSLCVIEALIIGYLFRALMKKQDERIAQADKATETEIVRTKEVSTALANAVSIIDQCRIALSKGAK